MAAKTSKAGTKKAVKSREAAKPKATRLPASASSKGRTAPKAAVPAKKPALRRRKSAPATAMPVTDAVTSATVPPMVDAGSSKRKRRR